MSDTRLRYFNGEEWVEARPGDAMFSTVVMLATEYYRDGEWKRIFEGETDGNDGRREG
jgi:hypothetical protein